MVFEFMPKGDEQFEEHIRSRPESEKPPAILYKYMSVETARIVLSTGKLRFQSPLRYNDPLDSQWDVFWPLFTPEAIKYEQDLTEQVIRNPSSWPADADTRSTDLMNQQRARINALPREQREKAIADFIQNISDRPMNFKSLARRFQDIRRRMRVLCLCGNVDSILMWSHYADQHRGIVLGFDSAAFEKGLKRPLEPVVYRDGPPQLIDPYAWIRAIVCGSPQPELTTGRDREWVLTKHSSWTYEREWRFVLGAKPETLGDYEDFAFPRASLMELVAGCRTDAVRGMELLALAGAFRSDVRHFQMSVHPSRFELVKTEIPASS